MIGSVCAVIRLVSIVWLTECRERGPSWASVRIFGVVVRVACATFLGTVFLGISPRFGFENLRRRQSKGPFLLEATLQWVKPIHHCFITQLLYNTTTTHFFMQWIASILFYLQAQWCQVPSKKYMTSLDTNLVCRFHQWNIRSNPPYPLFLESASQRNLPLTRSLIHSLTQHSILLCSNYKSQE